MGVVIRRWVWLEFIGVVSGCFPHIYIMESVDSISRDERDFH